MSIYVFSILSGYEMGGVDVAQARRDRMLERSGKEVKYIFTDAPEEEYIQRYKNLGIAEEKMLSAHAFLTGKADLSGRLLASDWLAKYQRSMPAMRAVRDEERIEIFDGSRRVAILFLREEDESVYAVNHYEAERLIARDIYTDRLMWTQHFVTADDGQGAYAKKTRTTFFDETGSACFEAFEAQSEELDPYAYAHGYNSNRQDYYIFRDGQVLDSFAFLQRFISELKLTAEDVVILDRPLGEKWIEPLFRQKTLPKILVYYHSDHYFLPGEEAGYLGWNKEYLYYIRNADKVAGFVVASEEQKEDMQKRLREYGLYVPKIYAAPTCGLEKLEYPKEERRPYSLLTASRLHPRKKVDLIIRAVIKAHEKIPQLNMDIYGSGIREYVGELRAIVADAGADDYIRFVGHQDMAGKYPKYEAYISASTWETLGLSMMEAVASGNAIINWDVRYSGQLFVRKEKNGRNIPVKLDELSDPGYEEIYVRKMADAIVDVFGSRKKLRSCEAASYEIAKTFLDEGLADKWVNIIREIVSETENSVED